MKDSAGLSELQAQIRALRQQLATLEQQQELMLYTLSGTIYGTPVHDGAGLYGHATGRRKRSHDPASTQQY